MESLLVDELRALGAQEIKETRAGASFTGTLETAYRACLWLRTANRVLSVLGQFSAETPEALYEGIQTIQWQDHFDNDQTFAVDFNTSSSKINHSHFGSLKVKDAIVDQFRTNTGTRPSVDTDHPDIRINIYLLRDMATVSLDLAGDSLHLRGYRSEKSAAPLKENLAAAILLRAGWPDIAKQGGALVDPMCGAGTLLVEAAFIAGDIAPGLARTTWGFLSWKQHDAGIWDTLLEEAETRRATGLTTLPSIRGSDNSRAAVNAALINISNAHLKGLVHVDKAELESCKPGREGDTGLVVVNPPYGERIGEEAELVDLYRLLGTTMKDNFLNWRASMFTGNPDLGKKMGLRAHRRHTLFNGALECKLLHFNITPEWFVSDRGMPRPLYQDQRSDGAQMFANRLQKNIKRLRSWLKKGSISCYRLYDADLPEYAVAIDIYQAPGGDERWVHVQEYAAPKTIDPKKARLRLRESLAMIIEVLGIKEDHLFFKVRQQQKGQAQYEKLDTKGYFHPVMEGGLQFWVNFENYLDTGLFLDHRPTRQLIAELAPNQRFLNLFAYTGTATVYAAHAGASASTTIDMSNTYLDWAKRNLALNKLDSEQHTFIKANCLEWLILSQRGERYDLIFCDPPSFSTSKSMETSFDIQRDHVELIWKTMKLLEQDGTLIFSNNFRRFKMDHDALKGMQIENISSQTLPKDFERNPRIHNCWKIQWSDPEDPISASGSGASPR